MIKYLVINRTNYGILEPFRESAIEGIIYARSPQHAKKIAIDLGYNLKSTLVAALGYAKQYFEKKDIDWDSKPVLYQMEPTQPTPTNPRGAGRKPKGIRKKLTLTLAAEDLSFLEAQEKQSEFVARLISEERTKSVLEIASK